MSFSSRYGVIKNTKNRIISLSTAAVIAVASLSGAAPLFLSQKALAVTGVTHTVCASGCDFTTVQAAVDAAAAGDTVSIGNGTYTEAVNVSKSLTIVGANKANTKIVAPSTMTGSDAIVTISGVGVAVDMSKLTVEGPGPTNCGSIYAGVYVTGNADATLRNMNVKKIRDAVLSGCQNGRAIYVGGTGVGTATINNVSISDYQKGGVYVSNSGSSAVVTSSDITGAGPTTVIAQNGMAAINGARLRVNNTVVTGNDYTPSTNVATGVLLFNAKSNSSVNANNTITGNEIGVYTTNTNVVPNIGLAAASSNGRNAVADTSALSTASNVYVDGAISGTADDDGNDIVFTDGANHLYGYDAFSTIQSAVNGVATGGDVNVAAGTYVENVNLNKEVSVWGAGAATTSIVATNGNATPVFFSSNNATVDGFTITHNYTSGELSAWNFNNNGVQFGQLTTGNTLSNSVVTLNRNGVYINNAQGNKLIGNTITNNRTGLNMTNTINGTQITGNTISENWTIGMVMYSAGLSADLSTLTVTGNTFDKNWYTEVLVKDAPLFSGTLDMSNNTFTDTPVTYSTSSSSLLNEPGFTDQHPAVLGGSATKPVFERPTLRIYNSANVTLTYTSPTLDVHGDQVTYTNGDNVVTLPTDAVVTPSNPSWDGIVKAPTVYTGTITLPNGTAQGVALEVGSSDYSLTFDKAARLLIKGEAGKRVGFQAPGGSFTEITTVCSTDDQATMNTELSNSPAGECKMNVGGDLVVWTKHFTTFVTFSSVTPTSTPTSTTTTSSSSNTATVTRVTTTAASVADTAASVLGIGSGTDSAKTTKKAASAQNDAKEDSDAFLGLGWWWIAVLAVLGAVLGYLLVVRRADRA